MGVQRPARILVVAVFAALMSGCAAEPVPDPTPTPTFASEAEAFAAAEATYRAYVDALNQVDLADPETFEAVYAWTTGDFNASERESLSTMHANGWTVRGASEIARLEPIEMRNGHPVIGSCLDVSGVELVDSLGSSQVASDRPRHQQTAIEFSPDTSTATGLAIFDIVGAALKEPCGE